jgi:hypothetical protein
MSYELMSTPGEIVSIRGLKIELGEETKLVLNKDAYRLIQTLGLKACHNKDDDIIPLIVNAIRDLQHAFMKGGIKL